MNILKIKLPKGYKWTEESLKDPETRSSWNAISIDDNNYIYSLLILKGWSEGYYEAQFFTDDFMYKKPVECKCCGNTKKPMLRDEFIKCFTKDCESSLNEIAYCNMIGDMCYPTMDNATINNINNLYKRTK
tara:strand:- start:16675 stop:17067 length:393 start_codon:yes stop_codon:yes gene_type:complete